MSEPYTQSEPYRQSRNLNKGRVVIYRGIPRNSDEPIGERPAIILRVPQPNHLPGDPPGVKVDLYPFFINDHPEPVLRVPYNREKIANTWCWVDEQDFDAQDI